MLSSRSANVSFLSDAGTTPIIPELVRA
jgi:hypothetical protein